MHDRKPFGAVVAKGKLIPFMCGPEVGDRSKRRAKREIDKIDPLVSHTSCGQGIPKGSGQQTRHPTKCNRSSNNVDLRRIRILGSTFALLHCSQGFTPVPLHSGFTPPPLQLGFHTHSTAFGFHTQGLTLPPLQSGFHTRSTAFGFHTSSTAVRVSHPHHCSQGFTLAPLHSGFTPAPLQSGFHTRSTAFGFHTHTTTVRVSQPLHCIRVSHPLH
ncbi:hypothetical protein CRG98_014965 [Punica granatum]|uniref:Uncharacterized protein n=1 Tax=Punica granatum TaxID=22663 RepID=A0A2I0K7V1_PUNGR|nr:hypothetical protein CRG98_014965 [Punica granatum]